MDGFWAAIGAQLTALQSAGSADDVVRILGPDRSAGDAFFAGSGGDDTVQGALYAAGWHVTWQQAPYYYVMRAPNGDVITYVEGDVYRGDVSIRD